MKGILYYNNGDRYEGEFKNYLKERIGIMYYNDCEKCEEDWKNNIKEEKA